MKLDAGKLDSLILIYRNVKGAKNTFNEETLTPTLIRKCYAYREDNAGAADNESYDKGQQIITRTQVAWVVRHSSIEIKPEDWLMCGGVRFDINRIPMELGRKQFLKIVTEQKDNV